MSALCCNHGIQALAGPPNLQSLWMLRGTGEKGRSISMNSSTVSQFSQSLFHKDKIQVYSVCKLGYLHLVVYMQVSPCGQSILNRDQRAVPEISYSSRLTARLPLAILAKADGLFMFLEGSGLVVQTGGGRRPKASPAAKAQHKESRRVADAISPKSLTSTHLYEDMLFSVFLINRN